jgi:imidazolonepropionase-like amidohydrolase
MNGRFVQRTRWSVNGTISDQPPVRVDSTIDLANGWVVPPFGDAHTHNLDGPFNIDSVRASYVREGTMYVQVLTNSRTGADRVRARWGRPCELDVAYANGGLTSTLSHPFLAYEPRAMGIRTDWAAHAAEIRRSRVAENNSYFFLDSLADLERKWGTIMEGRPDVVKIFLLDAVEQPPAPSDTGLPTGHGLKPSLVPEIVRRAHAAGLRVAAHVETANDARIAIRAGVDMLAHLPGYEMPRGEDAARYLLDEETAKLAGAQGLVVTPTLSLATVVADSADDALAAERRRVQDRNIRLLVRHGVHIVVGSDWFGRTASGEFRALAASGIWSPSELLRIWSEETPRAIFPRRRIGRLDDGYEASFLVFATDPTRDFTLPAITTRVKQGCVMTP